MPKLSKLDQQITLLNGTGIVDLTGKKPLTMKSALISICEMHQPATPGSGEHIMAFEIGGKLFKAKDSVELEESELTFLKKLIQDTRIFTAIVIGNLNRYLSE